MGKNILNLALILLVIISSTFVSASPLIRTTEGGAGAGQTKGTRDTSHVPKLSDIVKFLVDKQSDTLSGLSKIESTYGINYAPSATIPNPNASVNLPRTANSMDKLEHSLFNTDIINIQDKNMIDVTRKYPIISNKHGAHNTGSRRRTRASRESHVIDVDPSAMLLPWEQECSGGYRHCEGFFPDCCPGFVCYRPLTDWDKRYGIRRCWPSYFLPDARR